MKGGLELSFKGKGVLAVLLGIVPQAVEATVATLLSKLIFDLPWVLCIPNGILLSAISPSILVPGVMILIKNRYGIKKGVP